MKRLLLPALSLLLFAAATARAEEQPVVHELHVQLLPAGHTAIITDRIVLPPGATLHGRYARFRVRAEFELLGPKTARLERGALIPSGERRPKTPSPIEGYTNNTEAAVVMTP